MARRILIVGNGVAGITAALAARRRDDSAAITVVGDESPYFFSRTALMYALMDKMTRRDLEPFERKTWAEQRIERVHARVTDLDAGARTVALSDGGALAWDRLLLATGAGPRELPVEGISAAGGVVRFVSMQDLDACERWIPGTREAVVIGGGLIGVELVECLMHHGVRTTFLVREPWYWPAALCREEGEMIAAHLRGRGVDLRTGCEARAVRRDAAGRVRSVELSDGGELPAQLLGVCVGVAPAVDWLRAVKTPPALARGIVVDGELRTGLGDVWAAGDCAEVRRDGCEPLVEQTWYGARRQGELAGRNMTGRATAYAPPRFYNSAKLFDVEYTTVGDARDVPAGASSLYRRHPTRPISQRVVHHGGRVRAFHLLGSRWDHALLSRWIDEDRAPSWVLAHLPEAQFDVEFGRVPLGEFVETALAPIGAPS